MDALRPELNVLSNHAPSYPAKLESLSAMTQAISEQTLQQLFARPYGSLTIQRPIKHFAKAIGFVPRVPGEPNSDTLAKIYTNHRFHEAMVRSSFNSDTDRHNFENLVRGRNKTKDEIRGQLARQLGVTEDILMQMVHGRQDGPLLPQLLDIFNMAEGFFSWIFNKALEGYVPCPHYGNNVRCFLVEHSRWTNDAYCDRTAEHPCNNAPPFPISDIAQILVAGV